MAARESRSLLGKLFGNVWAAVVAPVLVTLLSGVLAYQLGLVGGQSDSRPPAAATPRPAPGNGDTSDGGERGAAKKAAGSPDFDEFAR
jgi:hypothetical protein